MCANEIRRLDYCPKVYKITAHGNEIKATAFGIFLLLTNWLDLGEVCYCEKSQED